MVLALLLSISTAQAGDLLVETAAYFDPDCVYVDLSQPLLKLDVPTRVLSFDADAVQRTSSARPMAALLRAAPGVYAPRTGGLYMNGAPAGFGSLRIDGVIIDRPGS